MIDRQTDDNAKSISITAQGSFAVGGVVKAGRTLWATQNDRALGAAA